MRRSWDFPASQQQQHQGWEMNSRDDYHDHLSKMIRTPSVLPNVPHYPNVHMAFNRPKVAASDEARVGNEVKQPKSPESHGHKKSSKHAPQFPEKVEVIELKEAPTAPSAGRKEEKPGALDDGIDSKADVYIQERRQKFELCKWATFKVL